MQLDTTHPRRSVNFINTFCDIKQKSDDHVVLVIPLPLLLLVFFAIGHKNLTADLLFCSINFNPA